MADESPRKPRKRATKAEIALRRDRVAEMLIHGLSERAIALALATSQATVHRDKQAIFEAWQASALIKFDAAKARELARIDRIEEELWKAWFRSLEPVKRKQKKVKGITLPGDAEAEAEGAVGLLLDQLGIKRPGGKKRGKGGFVPFETEVQEMSLESTGNVAYMKGIQRCVELRIRIYGFDKLQQPGDGSEGLHAFMDALQASTEAAWSGMEAPQWEERAEDGTTTSEGDDW